MPAPASRNGSRTVEGRVDNIGSTNSSAVAQTMHIPPVAISAEAPKRMTVRFETIAATIKPIGPSIMSRPKCSGDTDCTSISSSGAAVMNA